MMQLISTNFQLKFLELLFYIFITHMRIIKQANKRLDNSFMGQENTLIFMLSYKPELEQHYYIKAFQNCFKIYLL